MVLLDTHVWVWSVEGNAGRVGRRARRLLSRAESHDALRISPVTLFEITALHTAGRLRFACSVEQWLRQAMDVGSVRIADLSASVAIDAGQIPPTALADPLDRLLVATARNLDAVLLTRDKRILDYASASTNVRVSDASL